MYIVHGNYQLHYEVLTNCTYLPTSKHQITEKRQTEE